MEKQTTIPKVDEDFMREVISQGFPMKKESLIEKDISVIIKEDKQTIEIPKVKEISKQNERNKPITGKLTLRKLIFPTDNRSASPERPI